MVTHSITCVKPNGSSDDYLVLSLTGCISTSPGITNLFLVDIRTQSLPLALANSTAQYFHIRIGYFGMAILAGLHANLLTEARSMQATMLQTWTALLPPAA